MPRMSSSSQKKIAYAVILLFSLILIFAIVILPATRSVLGATKVDVTNDASLSSTQTYWTIPLNIVEAQDTIYGVYLSRLAAENTKTAYDVEFSASLSSPAVAIYKYTAWDSNKPIYAFACPRILPWVSLCLPTNPVVGYEAGISGAGTVQIDYTFTAKRLQNNVIVEADIEPVRLPYAADLSFFGGKVKLQNLAELNKGYLAPAVADAKVLYITDMATLKKNAGFDKDCTFYGGSGNSCYIAISNAAYERWRYDLINNIFTSMPSTPPNSFGGYATQSDLRWQYPHGAVSALVTLWVDASWVNTIYYQPPQGKPCDLTFSVEPNAQYGKEYLGTFSVKNCGDKQGNFQVTMQLQNARLTYLEKASLAPQAGETQTSTFKYIPDAGKTGGTYGITITITDSWTGNKVSASQSGMASAPPQPFCGDKICDPSTGESCSTCTTDCGNCFIPSQPYCGDKICNNNENYLTCPLDCPSPQKVCGDNVCSPEIGESYLSCPRDCPSPGPACTISNLTACDTKEKCDAISYYWYDNKCNTEKQKGGIDTSLLLFIIAILAILIGIFLWLRKTRR